MNLDPGIYPHRSTAEHRALPFFSPSRLGRLDVSPAEDRLQQEEPEETRAMRFGTLCHGSILEGSVITNPNWVEKPAGMSFTTIDGKAWRKARWAENPAAVFVPAEDFQRAEGAAESLRTHPLVAEWLATGRTEVSVVWDDEVTGRRLKGRIDLVATDSVWGPMVWDLKMLGRGVWADQVEHSVKDSGAWMQVPFYAEAMRALTGTPHRAGIIACSPEPPYPVECYPFRPEVQAAGLAHGRQLLTRLADYEARGLCPADSRHDDPRTNEITGWRWIAKYGTR